MCTNLTAYITERGTMMKQKKADKQQTEHLFFPVALRRLLRFLQRKKQRRLGLLYFIPVHRCTTSFSSVT